ncbi:hypothetical protein Tco_0212409 [Tanacetum coccineum]
MCEISVKSFQNILIVQAGIVRFSTSMMTMMSILLYGESLKQYTRCVTSKEPKDPLIMGKKELSTIPEKDKSSVENLDPIPSGSKGVSYDICDIDHSDAKSLLSQDILITSPKINFFRRIPTDDALMEHRVREASSSMWSTIVLGGRRNEGMLSTDNSNEPLLELPKFESFHFDLSFPRPPPEPPDV